MSQPYRSDRAAQVQPNRLLVATSALASAAAVASPLLGGKPWVGASFLFGLLAFAAFASLRQRRWPRLERGLIEADETGVRRDGRLLVARAEVRQGLAVPVGEGCLVRLDRGWPRSPVDIVVWNEEEGRRLLVALGLDASQSAVDLRGASGYHVLSQAAKLAIGAGLMATWFFFQAFQRGTTGLVAVLALLALSRFAAGGRSRIRVGVDGVHFRWLWMSEFTAFSDVRGILLKKEEKAEILELTLHDGAKRRIPLDVGNDEDASFSYRRVLQAYEAYRERQGSGDIEALARAGRDPAAWLTALRSLAAGANAGMRTAPVPPERLWSILNDPSAPAAARAGAAAALSSVATGSERRKIRIAADAIAEPRLRVAVEKAADEAVDEPALAEAIAEVDAAQAGTIRTGSS